MDFLQCDWYPVTYFFLSENIFGNLVYYSHILPAVLCLFFGIFLFVRDSRSLLTRILFFVSIFFAMWSFFDLILWASDQLHTIMFFWSLLTIVEPLMYGATFYFLYVFITGQDLAMQIKTRLGFLYLPILVLLPTSLNLVAFDLTNCDRNAIEGPLWMYTYALEILFAVLAALLALREFIKHKKERTQIVVATTGILIFFISLSWGNIVGSLTDDWQIAQYGLFGMPFFVATIWYVLVKYRAFNLRIVATEALFFVAAVIIFVITFLPSVENMRLALIIALIFLVLLYIFFSRGLHKQERQRDEILRREKAHKDVTAQLEHATKRMHDLEKQKTDFLSFTSHQLRSPLTAIKGYSSLILEGDYGEVSPEAKKAAQIILQSTNALVGVVSDYLDASRIELGQMRYDIVDLDINELLQDIVRNWRIKHDESKIKIQFLFTGERILVKGDRQWLRRVIDDLIDNAIKYTLNEGIVDIQLKRKDTTTQIIISDQGIGIPKTNLDRMFEKYFRAENARRINAAGTGLGLYIAKEIINVHKGKIWVESPGEGKGTKFYIELRNK